VDSLLSRRVDEFERRITFRLDRHAERLAAAMPDAQRKLAADVVRDQARRVPAGVRRRIRTLRLQRLVVEPGSAAMPLDGAARRTRICDSAATVTNITRRHGQVLGLATSNEPLVSIIIPVHGAIDELLACLRSIAAYPLRAPFEVIVANDASIPAEFEPVREVGGLVIVDNDHNEGFLATCNRAAGYARGDLIWLLNSDTELAPEAGDALVQTFQDFPNAGVVGSKLVYGDGTLQEAGGIVWRDASAWNYGRGGDPGHSEYDYARAVDYVSGASLMIDRTLWEQLDGFDSAFSPAYYEDTDLCMRAALLGREVIYQSGSVVVHHEGKSYGTDVSQTGKHYQVVNHETFFRKWSSVLAPRRANGQEPERERERHVLRRVLVIDARMLTPDQDSGSLRMQNLMVALTRMGCRCTFLPHNMAADEPYAEQLRIRGIEVVGAPRQRSLEQFLRRRGTEFDAVVLSRLEVAAEHLTSVRRWCPSATVIYDTVDLHFFRLARAARLTGDPVAARAATETRDDELAAILRSDVTLVCSTIERDLLGELAPDARVEVVGNVHMPNDFDAGIEGRSGVLFVGGFEHPPNVDAVHWFVSEILPLLVVTDPQVVVHVVGSRMIPEIAALAGPHVKVHGFVADLDPLYRSCRVSIAPLRFGAGVKGKVTQALAVGLPAVGTSVAIEGAPLVPGEHILVGDSAQSFADQVSRLLNDDELWHRISAEGRARVHQHFGPEAASATMADILDLDGRHHRVSDTR
jgi:O-antigen biosynthesis protein